MKTSRRRCPQHDLLVVLVEERRLDRLEVGAASSFAAAPRDDPDVEQLYVENGCLTNIPIGAKTPPTSEPWTNYLFVHAGAEDSPSTVVEIQGATQSELHAELRKFMAQPHVHLLEGSEDDEDAAREATAP